MSLGVYRHVVCLQIKNLRSQVSRQAIGCLTEMYTLLKRNMDPVSAPIMQIVAEWLLNMCFHSYWFFHNVKLKNKKYCPGVFVLLKITPKNH